MLPVETVRSDLALITLTIHRLREELGYRLAIEPGRQKRYLEGDATVTEEATRSACLAVGVVAEDYRRAVDASPTLLWLETETIRETLVGSADPGPYDMLKT
jgi:hypothetical protein